jgi:hypothetical protein
LSIHVTETVAHGVEPTKGHVQEISELEWHKIPVEEALHRLGSSAQGGLDDNQAQTRLHRDGKNVLSPPPTHRFRKMYLLVYSTLMVELGTSLADLVESFLLRELSVSFVINLSEILPRTPRTSR